MFWLKQFKVNKILNMFRGIPERFTDSNLNYCGNLTEYSYEHTAICKIRNILFFPKMIDNLNWSENFLIFNTTKCIN